MSVGEADLEHIVEVFLAFPLSVLVAASSGIQAARLTGNSP